MKKLFLCICLLLLFSCADKKVKVDKQETYYKEILAVEDHMRKLTYFKMNKVEDREYLRCNDTTAEKINTDTEVVQQFRFQNNEDKLTYIATTKVADEIQYITQYYRDGNLYTSYSQLPYDIKVQSATDAFVFFDPSIKAVDLKYYHIQKKKIDQNVMYTITLKDADGYNKKYPDDFDDDACGLNADYQAVKIELKVNGSGLLIEETITQTISYQTTDMSSEREGITHYEFYDLGIEDSLDFSLIDAMY